MVVAAAQTCPSPSRHPSVPSPVRPVLPPTAKINKNKPAAKNSGYNQSKRIKSCYRIDNESMGVQTIMTDELCIHPSTQRGIRKTMKNRKHTRRLMPVALGAIVMLLASLLTIAGAGTATAQGTFPVSISLTVPQVDGNSDSANDHSGTRFVVGFEPQLGSHSGCRTAAATYEVNDAGSVVRSSFGDPVALVGTPSGTRSRCIYNVTYTNPVASAGGHLAVEAGATATVSNAARSVTASYAAATVFVPSVSITVPPTDSNGDSVNDYRGTSFGVVFAPVAGSNGGCNQVGSIYVVGDSATAALDSRSIRPTLVNVPSGTTTSCQYSVAMDEAVVTPAGATAAGATLVLGAGATSMVSAAASSVSASYALDTSGDTHFTPALTITVPKTDSDGNGRPDAAETSIPVNFKPVAGSDSGCESVSVSYVVDNRGDAGLDARDAPLNLVDVPEGTTQNCVYELHLESPITTHRGDHLGLRYYARPTVSAQSISNLVTYASVNVFTPRVNITVPALDADTNSVNDLSGTTIRASFEALNDPGPTNCSNAAVNYMVNDAGDVRLQGSPLLLVDTPPGSSRHCQYAMRLTSPISVGVSQFLTVSPSGAQTMDSANHTVSASYAVQTLFAPTVSLTLPSGSDRAGANIVIAFFPVEGSNAGCVSEGATYTTNASGSAVLADPTNIVRLVDSITGVSGNCEYDVTMTNPVLTTGGPLGLQAGFTQTVTSGSAAVTASYAAVSTFAPQVTITVPNLDDNNNGENDLVGTVIDVLFEPEDGSNAGCTSRSTQYVVGSGDKALASDASFVLVDEPAGAGTGCAYDVRLPSNVGEMRLFTGGTRDWTVANGTSASGLYQSTRAPEPFQLDQSGFIPTSRPSGTPTVDTVEMPAFAPINVALVVPNRGAAGYRSGDLFEILVTVPGVCGDDTAIFGGVSARDGVLYGVDATVGRKTIIGAGAAQTNPRASYSIARYVEVGSQRVDCVFRVVEVSSPTGCALQSATQDSRNRRYVEVGAAEDFSVTAQFECAPVVGQTTFNRGWALVPFNGATGTSPADFAASLDNAISSLWLWNPRTQGWDGWTAVHGEVGLSSLTRGDVLMVYAPQQARISYTPADLLAPSSPTGSLSLAPGYNVYYYGGSASVALEDIIAQPSPIAVIFLWDSRTQGWRYHLPSVGPLPQIQIPWFDSLSPGDGMLIYNAIGQSTTITWA